MRAATADTHQWSMFSLVSQLPVGKRAPAYARYGTFCSPRCCLSRSLRLPPPFLRLPPRSLPFISPILDKKSKSAHRQGTISLGHLQSPAHISISPHFCSLSSLFSRRRINPKPLWEKPGHSNSKGTSESILHFISRLASVKPSVRPPARSLIYHFHQFFFWYRLTRVFPSPRLLHCGFLLYTDRDFTSQCDFLISRVCVFAVSFFLYIYMPLLWRGGLSSCLTSLRDQILTEHSAVGMARGTISSLRMQGSDVSWIRQINTVWSFIESPPSSSVCYKYLFSIQAAAAQFRQSIVYEYALRRRCFFFLWIFIVWLSTCVMHFWSGNN